MRINITRSIQLEQVPLQIASLLKEAQEKSDEISSRILDIKNSVAECKSASSCAEKIDSLRKELLDIDSCLNDSSTILSGYENILLNKNNQTAAVPMVDPSPQTEPQDEAED